MKMCKRLFSLFIILALTCAAAPAQAAAPRSPDYVAINIDTTWDTSQTFDSDVVVEAGATLTVAGSAVITFDSLVNAPYAGGFSSKNELIVENGGRLVVQPGARLTAPFTGDWYGVVFLAGSAGAITGAILENGVAGVTIVDASPSLVDSEVRNMTGAGAVIGTLAAGAIISGTSSARIENNLFYNLSGWDGVSGNPESGANGMPAGAAVGIYVLGATPMIVGNTIQQVGAGSGGSGGSGADGSDGSTPGASGTPGSAGGNGLAGGAAWGIRVEGLTAAGDWGIYNNRIQMVTAGWGGDGGDGGAGGHGADGADGSTQGQRGGDGALGGEPGDGAHGSPGYGIYIEAASPEVYGNSIEAVYGGWGGEAGYAVSGGGGDGGDALQINGNGGNGGNGANSCAELGVAGNGGAAYGIYMTGAALPDVRRNTIAHVEAGGGGAAWTCNAGFGGDGGEGGGGSGLSGETGDAGQVLYTDAEHSGHGGAAYGILSRDAAPVLARNAVQDVSGGVAGQAMNGVDTFGEPPADAGDGPDGGDGGNACGMCVDHALRIENNIVHNVVGGLAADGGDGGKATSPGAPGGAAANGGDGGEGGNGGSGWGIYADGANPEIVANTVVDMALGNPGLGGEGGWSLTPGGAPGADGDDGIPGRADGIFMDNGAQPAVVNNIVAQMTGNTGFGISSRDGQSGLTLDYNLVWNWPLGNYNNVTPSGGLEADPAFAGYAQDDFYLASVSPAINQGGGASLPTDDRDGVVRPQGSAADIGAYEYLPGSDVFWLTASAGAWDAPNGELGVTWEIGTVSTPITVTYTPRGLLYPAYPLLFGGVGFSLDPAAPVGLNQAITLVVHYDEMDLPAGVSESDLAFYRWNGSSEWATLTVIARDLAADTLTVQTDAWGDFALLGSAPPGYAVYLPLIVRP